MSSRKTGATLKHSKLSFADLRKRKTTDAQTTAAATKISTKGTPSLEEAQQQLHTPSLDIAASGMSFMSSTQLNGTGTQLYDQTQMDVDQEALVGATEQALQNRTSKLDAINNLDAKMLERTAERTKQD